MVKEASKAMFIAMALTIVYKYYVFSAIYIHTGAYEPP